MFDGILIDFSIYTVFESIAIIVVFFLCVYFIIGKIDKLISGKNVSIKDWVKIEHKESFNENEKENVFKRVFKKIFSKKKKESEEIEHKEDQGKIEKFKKKNSEETAILISKKQTEDLFFSLKENLQKQVKEIEEKKYQAAIYFGLALERSIKKVADKFLDTFEGILLSQKSGVSSIEQDAEMLNDYKNFSRLIYVLQEEVKLKVLDVFYKKIDKCIQDEIVDGCFDDDHIEYSKLILLNSKAIIKERINSQFVSFDEFCKVIKRIEGELKEYILAEMKNALDSINISIKKSSEDMKEVEEEINNTIEKLYE